MSCGLTSCASMSHFNRPSTSSCSAATPSTTLNFTGIPSLLANFTFQAPSVCSRSSFSTSVDMSPKALVGTLGGREGTSPNPTDRRKPGSKHRRPRSRTTAVLPGTHGHGATPSLDRQGEERRDIRLDPRTPTFWL